MVRKDEWIERLRGSFPELPPQEVAEAMARGEIEFVDVRESDEVRELSVPGSVHLPRGFLELRAESLLPDKSRPIVTACKGGVRSLFAAEALRNLGYVDIRSLAGGVTAWREAGLPTEVPRGLGDEDRRRYSRQIVIPEVGEEGQAKLLDARVLVVGAGGLGSPAALYLAAAGVGRLGVIDADVVEESNLQRQVLHTQSSVGASKVASARARLEALNPGIQVQTHDTRLDATNAEALIGEYDVVVDGTDNFETRYLINDVCVALDRPNVHGSVHRFDGQATVFWASRGPCYRCLYPVAPPPELAPT